MMIHNLNHEKFFSLAGQQQAEMATCQRARCGAVVVSPSGDVLGCGFNAPPRGMESQRLCGFAPSTSAKPKSDKTCCVHAEWNAVLNALTAHGTGVEGSTLYFMRVDEHGGFTEAGDPYCTVCSRVSLQAGVAVFGLWNDGPQMIDTQTYNQMSYDYYRG